MYHLYRSTFIYSLLLMLLCTVACSAQKATDAPKSPSISNTTLSTLADTVSYSIGINIANNLAKDGFSDIRPDAFALALEHVLGGKETLLKPNEAQSVLQTYFEQLRQETLGKNLKEGEAFLEGNKKKEGVQVLESGLQYIVLKEGDGKKPKASDKVSTHYHGTLIDGTVFDSSVDRGEPVSFPVNGVIKGWTEALQLMPTGSKWRLFVPPGLAYGERGAGGTIGPNATLIFEVELLGIEE